MAFYLSLLICVASRLIPHPANFTPIGSLILLNSKKSPWKGIALGILVMVISDIFLKFNFASVWVYAGFISYAFWGQIKKLHPVASVILGSISFFVISNFGVWTGPWYSHDLAGFLQCFANALPFYRNTMISDVVFVIVILAGQKAYQLLKNKYFSEGLSWEKSLRVAISKRR
jgi:hypothetical protein